MSTKLFLERGFIYKTESLGKHIDGWSELIEDKGQDATKVRVEVVKQLEDKKPPDINIRKVSAYINFLYVKTRFYIIISNRLGAKTTINVSNIGEDLFISWNSFAPPLVDTIFILSSLIFSFIAVLIFSSEFHMSLSIVNQAFINEIGWNDFLLISRELILYVSYAMVICFIIAVLFSFLGFGPSTFIGGSILLFAIALFFIMFIRNVGNRFFSEIIDILIYFIKGMSIYWNPLSEVIVFIITFFTITFLGAMLMNAIYQRNSLRFLIFGKNLAEYEEIIAMNIFVHKSILFVLDSMGIEVSNQHLKISFKGGK